MTKDIHNELIKTHKQKIYYVILALIVLINMVFIISNMNNTNYDWKESLKKDISECNALLDTEEIKNDEVMVEVVNDQIEEMQYRLDHEIPDLPSITELFINVFSVTTYLLTFVVLYKSSATLCSEYKDKTIYLLLMSKTTKERVIISKAISLIINIIEMIIVSVCSYFVMARLILRDMQFDSIFLQRDDAGRFLSISYGKIAIISICFSFIILFSYSSLVLLVAVFVKKNLVTILIGFLIYAFGSDFLNLLPVHYSIKNMLFPIAFDNVFLSLGSYETMNPMIISYSLVSLVVHSFAFYLIASKRFAYYPLENNK